MIDEVNQIETPQEATEVPPVDAEASTGTPLEGLGDQPGNAQPSATTETVEAGVTLGDVVIEDDEASFDASYGAALAEKENAIQALKLQLEERNALYARIAADFDNFRKRTQREREELEQKLKCDTILELLPVVDNFERARSQIKPQTESENTIHKSYQSVYKQLVDCLKRVGVSPMRAEGQEFDPNLHEAVLREATDEFPEGTVISELQRGYLLGDRVLRHAMVKVAATPDPVITSEENSPAESES